MTFDPQATLRAYERKRSSRGFTLLELMITLAVLAVLVGLAVPSFTRAMAEQRVRSAASDLHFALLAARSSAITRNEDVEISPATDGWAAGWSIRPKDGGTPTLREGGATRGVVITAAPAGAVVFRGSGRAVKAVAFSVVASSIGDLARCVRLDASGRPVTEKGACS